ncbi:hypothetical protein MJO29_003563 [Puccinia striiformis f. sp. tritici]|nr:hypothetical protein Pst134EB_005654 [Puccinia striiformis f. sp. tritici]KAI7965465.1 hypothetical protein MJO29_003563 [Puccinia striiformis f. sp. tritici]KAI9613318.1 hypothetical protein H4Q26_009918 [Puccinia striiformis f. sp. tritici PST-130]
MTPLCCPYSFLRTTTILWYLFSSSPTALAPEPEVAASEYIDRFSRTAPGVELSTYHDGNPQKRARSDQEYAFITPDGSTATSPQEPAEWTPVIIRNGHDPNVVALSSNSAQKQLSEDKSGSSLKRAREEPPAVDPPVAMEQDNPDDTPGDSSQHPYEEIMETRRSDRFPASLRDISSPMDRLDTSILYEPIMGPYSPEVDAYTSRYEVMIEKVLKEMQELPDSYVGRKTAGWPAMVFRHRQGHSYGPLAIVLPMTGDGDWRQIKSLVLRFERLHKWVVYVHDRLFNNPKTASNYQGFNLQGLLLWLFGEVFNPKIGLPAIGKVDLSNLSKKQVFGAPQRWILNFLADREQACTTSVAILGIWYLNNYPQLWQHQFTTSEHFWSQITALIISDTQAEESSQVNRIHLRLKSSAEIDVITKAKKAQVVPDPTRIVAQIGNFKLMTPIRQKTETGLSWLTNKESRILAQSKESKYTSHILEEISQVSRFGTNVVTHSFPEVGIALTESLDPNKYYIKMLLPSGLWRSTKMRKKIRNLLTYLQHFSTPIFLELNARGAEDSENLSSQFLSWFSEKLLGKRVILFRVNIDPNLGAPVVGLVDKTKCENGSLPPFDQVQLFIIKSLSSKSVRYQLQETSLALVGYWLKNLRQDIWVHHFKTDQRFAEFLRETV